MTLTNNELKAIAITLKGIKYPDTNNKFILEVYYGIFFRGLEEQLKVDRKKLKQKLENMQIQCPQQFEFLVNKMRDCWDKEYGEEELLARLSQLGLTNTISF